MNDALGRHLGLWELFALAAGAMISSGLFVLPGPAFGMTGPSVALALESAFACVGIGALVLLVRRRRSSR